MKRRVRVYEYLSGNVFQRILNPRFKSSLASFDVASLISQALDA